MLAQPRAKTHMKMILRCISKLCQLRTTSNKALSRHGSDIRDHNYDALSTKYELNQGGSFFLDCTIYKSAD